MTSRLYSVVKTDFCVSQFGFLKNKTISEASLNLISLINYANKHSKPLQLVSIDAESAFDNIFRSAFYQMLELMGIDKKFIKMFKNLINHGRMFVSVNSFFNSEIFDILDGTGQGNPAASLMYIIVHEVYHLLYNSLSSTDSDFKFSISLQSSIIKSNAVSFADDINNPCNLQGRISIKKLYEIFENIQKVIGYKINPNKTQILMINTSEQIEEELIQYGVKKVEFMSHLGIHLAENYTKMLQKNQNAMIESLEQTFLKLKHKNWDIFTKRLVVNQCLHSKINHYCMVFMFSSDVMEKIWKKILTAIFSKYTYDHNTLFYNVTERRVVAKNRVSCSFEVGGLQIINTEIKAKCLFIDSMLRFLRSFYKNSTSSIITHILEEAITKKFFLYGSGALKKLAVKNKVDYPFLQNTFIIMSEIIQGMEKSSESWFNSAIFGNDRYTLFFEITHGEAQILWSKNIFTLGDLFQEINLIKSINTTIEVDRFPPSLATKLKNIIKLIQKDKLVFNSVHTDFTHFQLFLECRILMPSTMLKEKFKQEQDRKFDVAPSYYSRIKDNIPVPHNKEIFKECYRFIVKLPTPVQQTSFNFHILNRTLWTTEKAYLSGKNETNKCRKNCDQIATCIHILIDCDSLANPIWSLFQKILRSLEKPVHINFFNIMYFVKIERMSKKKKS
jgi:hypothetical protein